MDLEPTEATENPLQSNTTTKSAEDDNAEENPVESESSSATTVEVKGKKYAFDHADNKLTLVLTRTSFGDHRRPS